MSILDLFLTPQNVQRGVNLLQGNQGIVNTLTGLPIGPSSGRAYIRNLSGSTEPITEDFFNTTQLSEIQRRTAEQMANKSMMYEPENLDPDGISQNLISKNVVPYNLESPLSMKGIFTDPKVDIDMTLGTNTYRQNPDGTISVIDTHDFDGIEGGGDALYGQGEEADLGKGVVISSRGLGTPRYLGERELPNLPPVDIFGRTQEQATAEEVIKDPFTGEVIKPDYAAKWREYNTPTESIYESKEETLKHVYDALKKGHITSSKFARIIGGLHGLQADELEEDYNPQNSRMREGWKETGIPVNINLGRISHRDKLKANPNFARYIADTGTIPSQIRQEAQKFAPRRIAPRHSPHGGGPGTGGGDYHSGQTSTVDGQTTDWGDMSHMIAGGGLAQHAPIRPYSLGGLAYLLYGGLV